MSDDGRVGKGTRRGDRRGAGDDESWRSGRCGRWVAAYGAGRGGLGRFRAIWAGLDRVGCPGPVWTGLGWSELAWVVLGRLGPAGAALTDWTGWFGPVCGGPGGLDRSGRSGLGRSGPAWTRFGAARLGGLAWSGQGGPVWAAWPGLGSPV